MVHLEYISDIPGMGCRIVAFLLLKNVFVDSIPLHVAKARSDIKKHFYKLSEVDQNTCNAIVRTMLKRIGQVEDIANRFIVSGCTHGNKPAFIVVCMAITEIFFMNTPSYCACSLAVSVAEVVCSRHKAMVNAVCRSVSNEVTAKDIETQDDAYLNTPAWLWKKLCADYGHGISRKIARINLEKANIDVKMRSCDTSSLSEQLGLTLPQGSLRITKSIAIQDIPGYKEGRWWIQGAAATFAVNILESYSGVRNKECLDLCAAPGGKTMQMVDAGGYVTAVDISKERMSVLSQNLKRTGLYAEQVVADIMEWSPEKLFPIIVLDAPCSGSGVIRNNPDIPYVKRITTGAGIGCHRSSISLNKYLESMSSIQFQLLSRAWEWLSVGGCLLYAVCSIFREEGENVISAFCKKYSDAMIVPIKTDELPKEAHIFLNKQGTFLSLPHHWQDLGGIDGFYIARITKV